MHTGGVRGGGGYETAPPPRHIFEKLVNKNAIKRKIGGPPLAISPETLDPPLGILAKTSRTPSPGFSTRVHLCIPTTSRFLVQNGLLHTDSLVKG
jgi:hypothetical protein